jgi:hypothetical protein
VDRDRSRLAVDAGDLGVAVEPDPRRAPQALVAQQQVVGVGDREERGERDPVVRRAALLAEDLDVPLRGDPALDEGLDQAASDHAGADDDQSLACHVSRLVGPGFRPDRSM